MKGTSIHPTGATTHAGAAPLLLEHPPRSSANGGGAGSGSRQEGEVLDIHSGYMPRDPACLARSEFLLPLDPTTQELYQRMLAGIKMQPQAV
jgi:hypothetical protein